MVRNLNASVVTSTSKEISKLVFHTLKTLFAHHWALKHFQRLNKVWVDSKIKPQFAWFLNRFRLCWFNELHYFLQFASKSSSKVHQMLSKYCFLCHYCFRQIHSSIFAASRKTLPISQKKPSRIKTPPFHNLSSLKTSPDLFEQPSS
jgi:hypothetical protein